MRIRKMIICNILLAIIILIRFSIPEYAVETSDIKVDVGSEACIIIENETGKTSSEADHGES